MESIEKLDFDQHRRRHVDSSESTLAGDRSATNENTDNTFSMGDRKHENVADYRIGGSEKALHESQADQSLSWVMLNVENLDINNRIPRIPRKAVRNTESQASINPAGAQQTTQPPGDTTYRSESAFGQPPRTAEPGPVDQDGEDSGSEVDLSWGGELALERLEFHLAAWEAALEAEEWPLAVEHAAVLRTFNQLPSKDVEISARITPALKELATGYPQLAISLLNEVKNERTPFTTSAWTIALIKTDQLSAAKKWCTRLINITRERKLETHTAGFYLLAEILKKQGKNAEAAFYQTKFDAQNLKLEKWMKAALEVARLDVGEPNSPQEPVRSTLNQSNPTLNPAEERSQNRSIDINGILQENDDLRDNLDASFKHIYEMKHENGFLNRNHDKLKAENLKLGEEIQVLKSQLPENAPVLPPEEFNINMNQHLAPHSYEAESQKIVSYLNWAFSGTPGLRVHPRLLANIITNRFQYSDVKIEKCRFALGLAANWPQHPDSAALVEKILLIEPRLDYIYIPKNLGMPKLPYEVFNPLQLAVLKGNEAVVASLLKCKRIHVNHRAISATSYLGCLSIPANQTALQIACGTNRRAKIVDMLLAAGATLNCGEDDQHPITLAVRQNRSVTVENFGILEVLFRYGGSIGLSLHEWQDGSDLGDHEIARRKKLKDKLQEIRSANPLMRERKIFAFQAHAKCHVRIFVYITIESAKYRIISPKVLESYLASSWVL